MQKLNESDWSGAIFAAAGLERIGLTPSPSPKEREAEPNFDFINLDWMIPAPAQGAMVVVAMGNDDFTLDAVSQLNDVETEICTYIERQFLKTLEGGCTAPIGALATYCELEDTFAFKGSLLSIDGKQKLEIEKTVPVADWKKLGFNCANEILGNGGAELMKKIKESFKK
jgi:hydroxymethylbilane synthase